MLDLGSPSVESFYGLLSVLGQTLIAVAILLLFVLGVLAAVAAWNTGRYQQLKEQREVRARVLARFLPEDPDVEGAFYRDFRSEAELEADALRKTHTTEVL